MELAASKRNGPGCTTEYLKADRPPSSARGIHHTALLSSDVERTIRFYQGVLEFPLTEIIENRDYEGSNHFFFDVGNGNLLAFFDFPGLDLGPYAEVLGGLHHIAISVTPEKWAALRANLTRPASSTWRRAARRCTSATRTAPAWNCSPTPSARCTAATSSEPPRQLHPPARPGALYGLAIGDALGMPTQMLSRPEIVRRWGPLLTGFEPAPPGHPIAGGPARRQRSPTTPSRPSCSAGSWSPATARSTRASWPPRWSAGNATWPHAARSTCSVPRPSAPSPPSWSASPRRAGASGDTNGAAMRITPVGIASSRRQTAAPTARSVDPGRPVVSELRHAQHRPGPGRGGRRGRRGERGPGRRRDRRGHGARRARRGDRGAAGALGRGRRRRRPHRMGDRPGRGPDRGPKPPS